jgi:hypothetical protein
VSPWISFQQSANHIGELLRFSKNVSRYPRFFMFIDTLMLLVCKRQGARLHRPDFFGGRDPQGPAALRQYEACVTTESLADLIVCSAPPEEQSLLIAQVV